MYEWAYTPYGVFSVRQTWVFVAFRMLHSAVHCTINIVMLRFSLYLISSLAVWFIAARAMLRYLGGQVPPRP